MQRIRKKSCLLAAAALVACQEAPPETPRQVAPPEPGPVESTCAGRGELSASLSGAIHVNLSWPDTALQCESMQRPDARGVRLRFSGDVHDERLAIIVALPDLEAGATGAAFNAIVTITVEGSGRFFSTPSLGTCWATISSHEVLPDQSGRYNIVGDLSCVAPLGEFNGGAFVDVSNLHFSGIADWSTQ